MEENKVESFIKDVIANMPEDWLKLTTHRLDVYNEQLAKTEFLEQFEDLYKENKADAASLNELPTAFDYIRLGHPLSSVLEWAIAKFNGQPAENVISFTSKTIPIFAILRKNLFERKNTRIVYSDELPTCFNEDVIRKVYGYQFDLLKVQSASDLKAYDGTTVFLHQHGGINHFEEHPLIDFYIHIYDQLGSILLVNSNVENREYISEIQHVRRRETIAMTPSNSSIALQSIVLNKMMETETKDTASNKAKVEASIVEITGAKTLPLVASSGLSIQYAILMGLVHDAMEHHPTKKIKIMVPPNCYGGTNDQARRVAACLKNVDIVDLPVDGGNDMVKSIDSVLTQIADEDAIPYIIAEIPTNPRVEVPDLNQLREVLSKKRTAKNGNVAVDPVFILDQTFCPNVHFLGEDDVLASVRTISFASGSKFPSGGLCTAGYCSANRKGENLMERIALHLSICDNEATDLQYEILAKQLPTMIQRIADAYKNTREFVTFISDILPSAKINFVSEELAEQGFTPSVFSLDLPTKGNTDEEREHYKRALNLKLINMMITEIPNESKYCVSYGQLKGCYWTIPATSTQGTTKEGDKDYIARVAVSPNLDLDKHKEVFTRFVDEI